MPTRWLTIGLVLALAGCTQSYFTKYELNGQEYIIGTKDFVGAIFPEREHVTYEVYRNDPQRGWVKEVSGYRNTYRAEEIIGYGRRIGRISGAELEGVPKVPPPRGYLPEGAGEPRLVGSVQ